MKPKLTVVVGPTASGKSALATALAQRDGAEIVSADSVQIYRHFDIGSAKPTAEDRRAVAHHLVDCVDPLQSVDARRFVDLAGDAPEKQRDGRDLDDGARHREPARKRGAGLQVAAHVAARPARGGARSDWRSRPLQRLPP